MASMSPAKARRTLSTFKKGVPGHGMPNIGTLIQAQKAVATDNADKNKAVVAPSNTSGSLGNGQALGSSDRPALVKEEKTLWKRLLGG